CVPDDQSAQTKDDRHYGGERRGSLLDRRARIAEIIARAIKTVELARLLCKSLDHPDPRKHARQRGRLLAAGVPLAVVLWIDAFPKEHTATENEWSWDQRIKGQFWVQRDKHDADGKHLCDLQKKSARDLLEQAVQNLAVVGDSAHERADLMAVVVSQRE